VKKPTGESKRETFIGEAITPEAQSFMAAPMAVGKPGLPAEFSWRGKRFIIENILEEWKEAGDCRHGSGERYLRKHWFRIRTTEGVEMRLYFERQRRTKDPSETG